MLTEPPAPSVRIPNFDKPPPTRVRAYNLGANPYEYQVGPTRQRDVLYVDEADVSAVLQAFHAQGVALPIYKEHDESQGSFGAMTLERGEDGGIDQVWNLNPEGLALVAGGRWMYDSPEIVAQTMQDGRKHLREIRSGSLVNKPARTASRPLLMSAMAKPAAYIQDARKCLEHLGSLEMSCKGMAAGQNEKMKTALDLLNPVLGPAAAHIQSAIDEMDIAESADENPLPESQGIKKMSTQTEQPEVLQMSASDRDALKLGTEIIKMTGASNAAEALGKLEGERALTDVLKSELVKMGAELGIQGFTSDADKFAKYEPSRLLAYMATAPRIKGAVIQESNTAPTVDPSTAQVEKDMEDRINRSLARNGIKAGA